MIKRNSQTVQRRIFKDLQDAKQVLLTPISRIIGWVVKDLWLCLGH